MKIFAYLKGKSIWVAVVIVTTLAATALFADLVASDLPLYFEKGNKSWWMPAIMRPAALRTADNQSIRRDLGPKDTVWMPLCEYGPYQHPKILRAPPAKPDVIHRWGTDDRGRDVFARVVHGLRTSLLVGVSVALLTLLIGASLGVMAGTLGTRWDWLISRLIEVTITFPAFFLILTVAALAGANSIASVIVTIAVVRWPEIARLARGEALRIANLEFVKAARVNGASKSRIIYRHILPNALGPLSVSAAFAMADAMLIEGALSFLGFGVPDPTASLGEIIAQAYEHPHAWWLVLPAGAVLFLCVASTHKIANFLRSRFG